MPLPLLPIGIIALATGAVFAKNSRDKAKALTPEQQAEHRVIYETAINDCKDPDKLRKLAVAFQKMGQKAEATMLFLRADNAEAPAEVKSARTKVFRDAMSSRNAPAIRAVADAFDCIGAPGAARELREYAKSVESVTEEDANVVP